MMGNLSKMVGNRPYQGFISQPRQEMLPAQLGFSSVMDPQPVQILELLFFNHMYYFKYAVLTLTL